MKENLKKVYSAQTEHDLEELLEKWRLTLPEEFTLGTVGNGSLPGSHQQYPDLHFKADGKIPGLYYADLDPSFLKSSNGNSQVEFADEDVKNGTKHPK